VIKSVIFDFGGVLMRTHDPSGRRKWETRLGLEPGGAAQLVFGSELGRKAQLGQVRPEEIWTWLGSHLDLSAGDLAAFRRDFWAGDRVDRALADTIRSLRARYRTGLLSNSWARDGRAMAERFGLADCFDVFVTSAGRHGARSDLRGRLHRKRRSRPRPGHAGDPLHRSGSGPGATGRAVEVIPCPTTGDWCIHQYPTQWVGFLLFRHVNSCRPSLSSISMR
jgi:hypothetical protein